MQHYPLPPRYSMIALTVALILGIVLCYSVALPFLPALVWSLTLAVLFAPLERAIGRSIRVRGLSVPLTMLVVGGMIVVPVVLVSSALANEVINGINLTSAMFSVEKWTALAQKHPGLAPAIRWISDNLDLQQLLQSLTSGLGPWSANLVQGSVTGILNLLLTFYFLFYLLRDKARFIASLKRMMPLSGQEFETVVDRIVQTIFASVYGTAAVAALQGALGGLVFWWLDLPSPIFWGIVMGLLAVVPFLGAFIVWVPAAMALALNGQLFSAAVLVVWGTLVVGMVDNIVYPILVGRRIAMHSMISFIAIIGGLVLFGTHGIVLGPLIVAGTMALLEIWRSRLDAEIAAPGAAG
jgi:predicted PurR-regulated permease PerM